MTTRHEARLAAFAAIDSEREYQNERWGIPGLDGSGHNPHSTIEWLVYMKHYAEQGIAIAIHSSRRDNPNDQNALHFARKVAALGVVCMEQHGAPKREGY